MQDKVARDYVKIGLNTNIFITQIRIVSAVKELYGIRIILFWFA